MGVVLFDGTLQGLLHYTFLSVCWMHDLLHDVVFVSYKEDLCIVIVSCVLILPSLDVGLSHAHTTHPPLLWMHSITSSFPNTVTWSITICKYKCTQWWDEHPLNTNVHIISYFSAWNPAHVLQTGNIVCLGEIQYLQSQTWGQPIASLTRVSCTPVLS